MKRWFSSWFSKDNNNSNNNNNSTTSSNTSLSVNNSNNTNHLINNTDNDNKILPTEILYQLNFQQVNKNVKYYKNQIVKTVIQQDKYTEEDKFIEGSTDDETNNLLLSSDSIVQYAPIICSSHTCLLIPSFRTNNEFTTKKLIIWGGKKKCNFNSNLAKELKISEESLITYYCFTSNLWLYGENFFEKQLERPDPALFYHSFNYNPKNSTIYIYAGSSSDSGKLNFQTSNNLYLLQVDQWKWRKIEAKNKLLIHEEDYHYYYKYNNELNNNIPTSLDSVRGHSCIYRSRTNSLVVYGGNMGSSKLTDNMYEFDCESEQWYIIPQKVKVPARAYHNGVYCKQRDWLIVFGGEEYDTKISKLEIINDLCIFDFNDRAWFTIKINDGDINDRPISTFGHSTTILHDRFILTYGGCDRHYNPKSQCIIFDLFERKWIRVDLRVNDFKFSNHSAKHALESNENINAWSLKYISELPPLNCSSMAFDEKSRCLYFYGGYITSKEKCSSLFRVTLDLAILIVDLHFKYLLTILQNESLYDIDFTFVQ
ncbi:hypothetical protein ABK040_013751 [Willaertia magna]